MALWELDEFAGARFLGYVRGVPEDPAYRGAEWLPNQTTDDLAFEYIKGVRNRPVMAHVMGFDSEAPIAGRPGLGERVQGELPPIKRKARISEKEIIRFLQPRTGSQDVRAAINSVYDLTDGLLGSVQARVEWLRLKALSEDTVVYNEDGVIFQFDYGIDGRFQYNLPTQTDGTGASIGSDVGPAWSDTANATPLVDLLFFQKRFRDATGYNLGEFVISNQAWGYLLQNQSLRDLIRGVNAPSAILTRAEIEALFALYDLPVPTTYDVVLDREKPDGTIEQVRPLAADRGFLLPTGGGVGNTLWGPTAESRALIGTNLASQAPGIIAVTYATEEPPAEWIKAAAVAFPTMPNAHLLSQVELF